MSLNKTPQRIVLVDALRGVALFLIILIHFIERFNLFVKPEQFIFFTEKTDWIVFDWVFNGISGKAYSVFALLFGLSFFIQLNRQELKGNDFRLTFLWRLIILMVLGFFHSLVYNGDILHIYAIMGIPLIFLYKVNTKALVVIGLLFAIQIPLIYESIQSFTTPNYKFEPVITSLGGKAKEFKLGDSLWSLMKANFWMGRSSNWSWTISNGRVYQLFFLFIVGLILGRTKFFNFIEKHKKLLVKYILISLVLCIIFYIIRLQILSSELIWVRKWLLKNILVSYENLMITSIIVFGCSWLYIKFSNSKVFDYLASYGRMSLTNYVTQGLLGTFMFYGYGLAFHKYLGTTWCLIFGFFCFFLQVWFSVFWLKRFKYGPLEWLWRCLTYMDFSIPIRLVKVEKGYEVESV
jgi:uncharacterized protein